MSISELREAMRASRKTIEVDVPGVGNVLLRALSVPDGLKMAELGAKFSDKTQPSEMAEFWIELVALSIVDEKGIPFDDADGREVVKGLRIDQLTTLGNAAAALNGFTADTDDAKKNEN